MSSVAVQVLDAVTDKLKETSFGSASVERHIFPEIERKGLTPLIIVALHNKSNKEFDRSREMVTYTVAVALHYPVSPATASLEDAVAMVENIQDFLSAVPNHRLTTPSGDICLSLPYEMESMFNGDMLRETNVFFSVTEFEYNFSRLRTS